MKFIFAGVALFCFLGSASSYRPPKMTLSVRNPKAVTVTEHVFFDIKVFNYYKTDEHLDGRIVIAVFGDAVPMTALNFVSIAKGYQKGKNYLSYNNTVIHRIIPDFILQMGDIENRQGLGGTSIYGNTFRDEAFLISHASSGIVSMANTGKDTNGSQFFITLRTTRYLDGHHVAFGKVISGMELLQQIGNIPSYKDQTPMKKAVVTACGIEGLYHKYDMTKQHLETDSEILKTDEFYPGESDEK